MTVYLIPFSYGWATRAQTALDRLSFFIIWIIPVWFVCGMPLSLRFVVGVIAEYSLYEIGYLFNDYCTVKKERKPTHRLPEHQRKRIEKHLIQMVAIRMTIVVLSLFYLRSQHFVAALAFIGVAFALHNTIRCNWNILTYFLLCLGKYLALPALFVPGMLGEACLALFLPFVLPRTIEHASKPKYYVPFLKTFKPHHFRAAYGFVVAIYAAVFAPSSLLFYVALWYYVYRALVLAAFIGIGDPRKKPSPQR
ncbi:MAG: hypothetical protein ACOYIR_01595 [Christensenellales bacterium]|jgi:hypothetical protein